MDYVIVVQASAYALSATRFATESAFAEHLKALRQAVGPQFSRLVLIAPTLPQASYEQQKAFLGTLDADTDEIVFVPAFPEDVRARQFWSQHARPLWRRLKEVVAHAGIVHSGMSTDTWRPLMVMANLAAWKARRPVVFIVDIDFRQHSWRLRHLGTWSRKAYWVNRLIHDPMKWVQVWLAARMFALVLLKSASMVRDFGQGRANVKNFFDTVHGTEHILSPQALAQRQAWLADPAQPLELAYFGRLVAYKGMDRVVEAVRIARSQGVDVRLTLIGAGDCLPGLQAQVAQAGLGDSVRFLPQVPYGPALFDQLERVHFSLAAPLMEDTPRSAFDSMARGIPILAFDITYFKDLAQASGAVALVTWPSSAAMAEQLVKFNGQRAEIASMAARAVAFAEENTQQKWLDKRIAWTQELAIRANPSQS